jgi:N-succinyldiaminopimelate aminotransferase
MPRYPKLSARSRLVGGSVFEKYRARLAAASSSPVKLHIGDRHGDLPYDVPIDKRWANTQPGIFQYCNTYGIKALREVVSAKLRDENQLDADGARLMITSGASNALSNACSALLDPGDELILLTPAWPFFAGLVRLAGGVVVELPIYSALYEQPNLDLDAALESMLSDRSVALYVNTPNNPSGKTLSREQLETIAAFARRHNLWVISDEAYDGLSFDDREHISIASLPEMEDRCLSAFTFSKAYAFAGIRLGYLVSSPEVVAACNRLMIHQLYGPNSLGQAMLVEPMRTRAEWLPAMRAQYQDLRDAFIEALGVDVPIPEGSYFVFFDTKPHAHGRDFDEIIGECIDAAVTVAPGGDFGSGFESYLRLCFTGDETPRVLDGARRLRRILRG